jgi:hypothetical protein
MADATATAAPPVTITPDAAPAPPANAVPTPAPAPDTSSAPDAAPTQVHDEPIKFSWDGAEISEELESPDAARPDKLDPKITEALKADPALVKQVEREFHENKAFRRIHETPKAAQEFKAKVESLGGVEKIETELGESASRFASLQAADPAILETYWTEAPEGMARLSGNYLDTLNTKAPEVYQYHMASRFMGLLRAPIDAQGRTFISVLNEAYNKAGDNKELKALLGALGQTVNEMHDIGSKAPKQLDPAEATNAAASRTKATEYVQGVTKRANGFITSGAQQAIRHLYRGQKLGPEREKDLTTLALIEWDKVTGPDAKFISDGKALISSQDNEGFNKFLQARIAKEMPKIARAIARRYAGRNEEIAKDAQTRKEVQGAGTREAATRQKYTGPRYPGTGGVDPRTIDHARMRGEFGPDKAQAMIANGEFYLKGQKPLYFL